MQVTPSLLMIILLVFSLSRQIFPPFRPLADGLDGTLEAGGCLQLQLVGHGVDLEPIQPGKTRK